MARPKPNVLLEKVDPVTYKAEQVLEAGYVYAVFFQGKPINLRVINKLVSYPGPKYKNTSWQNPGYAINLAERLNKQFNTDEFSVYQMSDGVPYVCPEDE